MTRWLSVPTALLFALYGCSDTAGTPDGGECTEDAQCTLGQLCQAQVCVAPERLRCLPGDSAVPVLAFNPDALDFGTVGGATVTRTLSLQNSGACTLSIVRAELDTIGAPRFACPLCTSQNLPLEVYPDRELALDVLLLPGDPGAFDDALILEGNDPERPRVRIPLRGASAGVPILTVTPDRVDFGFVPGGARAERLVTAINTGVGTATLTIDRVTIEPADSTTFSFSPPFTRPLAFVPARTDPNAGLPLSVAYHPTGLEAATATLVITPASGAPVRVPLSSTDQPPTMVTQPASIDFGVVRLGQTMSARVTIQNTGLAPLVGTTRLSLGTTTDLQLPRPLNSQINPGGVFELAVVFSPTVGGPVQDALVIETNDPNQTSLTIPIVGTGEAVGDELVTVEMRFSNDSNSVLDLDIRDVDLVLENPQGLVCREAQPQANWSTRGLAAWSASPPRENPERIVLSGVSEDGEYVLQLNYIEDCSSLPTALAASLLGIGTESLVDYFSEGEAMVDPGEVSNAVEELCAQRRSTNAVVTVRINNTIAAEETFRMQGKNTIVRAFRLVRANGRFSVMPGN